MQFHFRKAVVSEIPQIWEILQQAIDRRKKDGSDQWQDGYPNQGVIQKDIESGAGYVLTEGDSIAGYSAVMLNNEPAYADIDGKWLTNKDFVVIHRVAISENYLGKGLAQKLLKFVEEFAVERGIYSIKADTNFDNLAMMRIFEKLGYVYCGEVSFRGSARRAYEKVLERQVPEEAIDAEKVLQ
ncbi:GNAT family N-acetyltransferase [Desertivirga brevis]|uniref:GNAT family N-acetyltransferase n=1 Tax=Desertivirga brevis TaxID=2810310 RepID=UPI001A95E187|nr:GNAT family N-acetyltransferase [Pedobacter sp. SYSU D00873]